MNIFNFQHTIKDLILSRVSAWQH